MEAQAQIFACHGSERVPLPPFLAAAGQTGPVSPSRESVCSSAVPFPPEVTRSEVRPREPAEQLRVNSSTLGVRLHEALPGPPCVSAGGVNVQC